ncbi:MAG TPA: hypothetical protein VK808_01215 [Bacteroidia bacterium]|jgi:hypothetical protein|nr:hypothetical protein [Bacteroidia bacterium]
MKPIYIAATAVLSITAINISASGKNNEATLADRQDTPKLDSTKHNHKPAGKKLKQNKDSLKKTKKDTV